MVCTGAKGPVSFTSPRPMLRCGASAGHRFSERYEAGTEKCLYAGIHMQAGAGLPPNAREAHLYRWTQPDTACQWRQRLVTATLPGVAKPLACRHSMLRRPPKALQNQSVRRVDQRNPRAKVNSAITSHPIVPPPPPRLVGAGGCDSSCSAPNFATNACWLAPY
jgi:hypothetical protein